VNSPGRGLFDEVLVARARIARLAPVAGFGPTAAGVVVSLVRGAIPVVVAVAMGVTVGRLPDAIAARSSSAAWRELQVPFLVASLAFVGQQVLEPVQSAIGELLSRRVDGHLHDRLMAAALAPDEIAPLEDPDVLDELGEATHELEFAFRTPGAAFAGLVALLARYVQLAGHLVAIGVVLAWWAALLLLGMTLLFRHGQRGGLRRYARVIRTVATVRREVRYLRDVAMGAPAAKEIRVFGLAPWFTDRYRDAYRRALAPVWAERRRIYLWPYVVFTAAGLVAAAAVLAAAGRAAGRGDLTLVELSVSVQAALGVIRLGEFYPESDTQTQYGMNAYDALGRFEEAVGAADASGRPRPADDGPAAGPRGAIRLRDVTFTYAGAGAGRPVLDHLDLEIPAGQCTGVVGVNGAGKTTLVKLLTRLYTPDSGAITVDGTDLRDVAGDAWRRAVAVIFQDFARYELSAATNIGFGAIEAVDDREGIHAAARDAGLLDTLQALPEGLDTVLSRRHPGGVDLSGGQWQRLAIARALFALRHGASVFVLDEPTAELDIRAEAEFFARFQQLTSGRTSILISHRFSSVRHADRIVVLDAGRVVETGTHGELVAQGGRYATMFALQAERFTAAAPGEERG
jgi:ATP-binding cassette subfamily B protein